MIIKVSETNPQILCIQENAFDIEILGEESDPMSFNISPGVWKIKEGRKFNEKNRS